VERLRRAAEGVFGALEDGAVDEMAEAAEWIEVPGGSEIFREDEPGDSMCLLLRGRLQVRCRDRDGGPDRLLGEIAPGEAVGEIALLTGRRRSATVTAIRDSLLVRIDVPTFDRLAAHHPALWRRLSTIVVDRLLDRDTTRRFAPRVSNIAIVPGASEANAAEFASALSEALAHFGATLRLDAARVESHGDLFAAGSAPPGSPGDARLAEWLAEQEATHRFVLLQAQRDDSPWTRRCLRQADLVVVVGEAGGDPSPSPAERALLASAEPITTARRILVLVRPEEATEVSGTAAWLARRDVDGFHHVRRGVNGDFERLARILSGNATGLVLGGGAARGFAHVGVFRALVERGVAVDFVGGSSIGAVFASAIALGWDPDRLEATARKAFVEENPLGDFTLPIVSLLRGKRLERLTQRYFAGDIEDLPIPFFCVSSNLTAARLTVHERGPLWRAVRASVALPGVLPPAVDGDHLVIDGGVLNNLPVDVMRDRPVGRVIAVDLSVRKEYSLDYNEIPGALRVLRSRLPFARKIRVPGILTLMMKSTEVGSLVHSRSVRDSADLVLHPPVGRFGILETTAFDEIVRVGYEHAREQLETWNR